MTSLSDSFLWVIEALKSLIQTVGPLGLVIAMIIQAVLAPIPSELILSFAGAAFAEEYGIELGLFLAIVFGSLGSIAGAIVAFWIARHGGRPLVEKLVEEDALLFADNLLERYGGWAILVGRLTPFIPFDAVSYGAGLSKGINFRSFILPTIVGVVPRAIFYCSLGVIIDEGFKTAFELTLFILAMIVGFLVLAYYFLLAKYGKKALLSTESPKNNEGILIEA
ncbi:MAG: TVP38/TMEM64 family protein [Candidatus Hodarchaeota archaeon]